MKTMEIIIPPDVLVFACHTGSADNYVCTDLLKVKANTHCDDFFFLIERNRKKRLQMKESQISKTKIKQNEDFSCCFNNFTEIAREDYDNFCHYSAEELFWNLVP